MVEMVRCSSGHRFPVNMEKHQYRDYVMCPRRGCGVRVQFRKRKVSFNALWQKMREETRMDRRAAKEAKRKQPKHPQLLPGITRISMSQTLAAALAFSAARKKAEEEAQKVE